jgi:hypothetical protein
LGWVELLSKPLFSLLDVGLSVNDVLVQTEVWNKVVLVVLSSLYLFFGWENPLVTNLL